ncbi:hypothetical protein L0F63_001809, partial [Massospora cicadina]
MYRCLRGAYSSNLKVRAARAMSTKTSPSDASAVESQVKPNLASTNWDVSCLGNPSHKVVGDVVDEHLALEAATAVKYTRVVSSGGTK